jgi:hypothetical protein
MFPVFYTLILSSDKFYFFHFPFAGIKNYQFVGNEVLFTALPNMMLCENAPMSKWDQSLLGHITVMNFDVSLWSSHSFPYLDSQCNLSHLIFAERSKRGKKSCSDSRTSRTAAMRVSPTHRPNTRGRPGRSALGLKTRPLMPNPSPILNSEKSWKVSRILPF